MKRITRTALAMTFAAGLVAGCATDAGMTAADRPGVPGSRMADDPITPVEVVSSVGQRYYSDQPRLVGAVSANEAPDRAGELPAIDATTATNVGVTPTVVASEGQVSSTVNSTVLPGVDQMAVGLTPDPDTIVTGSDITPTIAAGASNVTSTVSATVPAAAVDTTTTQSLRGTVVPNATAAAEVVVPANSSAPVLVSAGPSIATATGVRSLSRLNRINVTQNGAVRTDANGTQVRITNVSGR